jgi:hypothetical protein
VSARTVSISEESRLCNDSVSDRESEDVLAKFLVGAEHRPASTSSIFSYGILK